MTYAGATLGWQVLEWGAEHLPSPADPSRELILTDEQADFVLRWYALDPDTGDFLYRRAELEMAKGWGKSPLAAFIALAEFCGPVVFDGWESPGVPIGKRHDNPWVQIAAVSEDQTDNTYSAIYEFLAANEKHAAKRLGIDVGITRLYLIDRPGRLEPVTAASGSREGQRVTFAILDETHLWTRRNGGVKLAGTIRRNAAKMNGRTLETTNAPLLGEKSVAEQSGLAPGVLHYARRPKVEPDPNWDDDRLRASLDEVYGDSYWIDRNRLVREIRDPATSWDDALRFYFNIRSAGSGRAIDPRVWDALAKPRDVPAGERIGVGFDGSISRDATVLRACTKDGYSWLVRAWVKPAGVDDWTVDRTDVEHTVDQLFATYDVGLMLCDPPRWWTEIDAWAERYGKERVVSFDTNQPRRFAPAVDRWLTAIREGTHTHDGDDVTDLHVKASHLRKVRTGDEEDDGRTRYVLIKGDDRGRIDAAVADVLAYHAAMTMPEATAAAPAVKFFALD